MEYQKVINMLYKKANPPSKCTQKYLIVRNDESRGAYDEDNQIISTTSMLRSSLCDCSDA